MIGQDFQDKLDAIVEDLQTRGKGQVVNITLRDGSNAVQIFQLSSSVTGEIKPSELQAIQTFVNALKPFADAYETEREPVIFALEQFKTAQQPHEVLMAAATLARKNLNDALEADANYQAKKTALETARENVNYVDALANYRARNVSENFGNLGDAKGKYAA